MRRGFPRAALCWYTSLALQGRSPIFKHVRIYSPKEELFVLGQVQSMAAVCLRPYNVPSLSLHLVLNLEHLPSSRGGGDGSHPSQHSGEHVLQQKPTQSVRPGVAGL